MAAFEFWYTMNSFTDTSNSKSRQLRRSSFLSLIKLHTSNCHLLKMNSFRCFSRILSKFYKIRYGLFEFSEHLFSCWWLLLYILEALFFKTPQSGCLLHWTTVLFFSWNIFILRIIQKTHTFILSFYLHDEREFHHCFSSCFRLYLLRRHPFKTFLYWGNLKILISLKELYEITFHALFHALFSRIIHAFVVFILFNTGLCKPAFSTDSFGRLAFYCSAVFVFSACSVSNLM